MRIIPTGSIPGADGEGLESITLVPGEKRLRITGTPEVVDAVARAALTLDTAELAAPPSPVPLEDRYQDFEETGVTTDELSRRQRTGPLASLEELGGDFWPEDESVDDFISAVREWRSEGGYRPTLNDEDDAEAWNEDE
jgi:hypothetical protein